MATPCKVTFCTDQSIRICVCEVLAALQLSEIESMRNRAGNQSSQLQVDARRGFRTFRIIGIDGIKPDLFEKHVQSLLRNYDLEIERVHDRKFFDR
jgi:hypothetical protein